MTTEIHIVDVGQGNMVLVKTDDGNNIVFDCNITDQNEDAILNYVGKAFGYNSRITAFICSHRDADHIRGIRKLHNIYPIGGVWDADYPGTTTNSSEYTEYMSLRRTLGGGIIKRNTFDEFGSTRFNYMSAADERLQENANAQGIVIKIE